MSDIQSPPGRLARLIAACASPRSLPLAVALATLLALPSLRVAFFSDDYFLFQRIEGGNGLDLYAFASGVPEITLPFIRSGPFGWWTDPTVKFSFFRPLASALLTLDWRLWGHDPLPYHLEALGWNALLVLCAGLALRRALPPATAGLATLLYAVDASRALPVGWIANRYALTCGALGWLALWAALRAREGARWGAPVSALALALALCCGESGLSYGIFLLALAWSAQKDRLRAALPTLGVLAIWALNYLINDHGARNSGVYLDPTADPLGYLAEAPGRLLALLASLLTGMSADLWVFVPAMRRAELGVGLVATALALGLYRGLAPALDPRERAALGWMLPASLLAILPTLATFPTDRLLFVPRLGVAAGAAALLRLVLGGGERRPWWARLASWGQLMVQGILPVFAWQAGGLYSAQMFAGITRLVESPALADVGGATVIMPAVSSPFASMYLASTRWFRGEPAPRVIWPLTMDHHAHRLSRPDEDTLIVDVVDGEMMGSIFEDLVRPRSLAFHVGDRVALDGGAIEVLALGPGGAPTRIALHLDQSLDDPAVRILALRDGDLVRVSAPPVGGQLDLPLERGPGGI